ncbi:MAG: LLM class flavin-dependent oxidoreductase [Dehalococcoidia bacterium]|nr:LLM class flavin-dependent oxidoreductase [Dehalococcoidia bacterium]
MELIRDFVIQAESLGYHSVWVQEQTLGSSAALEPLGLLTYVSGITSTIRLGVSVLVVPLRNPIHLAKSVSTIDQMSGGRLILGVGLGGGTGTYAPFGISPDARVARFTESVRIMKALWTQQAVDFSGRFHVLEGVHMEPKPVQSPHPPLWFGGRHSDALRRAVRYGDGWMGAGSSSISEFKEQIEFVKRHLDEAGRDPQTFAVSKRVYLAIDDNPARAERRLREWFGHYYRNADMASRVSIWGSTEHCIQTIGELQRAGAKHLLLNPVFDSVDHLVALAELTGL